MLTFLPYSWFWFLWYIFGDHVFYCWLTLFLYKNSRLNSHSLSGPLPMSLTNASSLQVLWVSNWMVTAYHSLFVAGHTILRKCYNCCFIYIPLHRSYHTTVSWVQFQKMVPFLFLRLLGNSISALWFELNPHGFWLGSDKWFAH